MKFIAHRINRKDELAKVPVEYGVELDLRDRGDRLILQHDPFTDGEDFEEYLAGYRHGTLILNIKSERIEHRVLELIRRAGVRDYFFLDSSFPMMMLLSSQGERNIAVRYSEYEGLDTVLALRGRVDWVWVDCFTKLPIDKAAFRTLKDAGFKLCLVSPELQGRDGDIERYRDRLRSEEIQFDAICTKLYNIPRWK
ncbi:MAG: phosphatidylinositol-specific phospholipase C/glycerophosphodiester phosphodiesterase family protein [Nitrospiraceae bacterium]|nr:phosphatidylinositol-specific phospholipase C/glycerophosphodiester phosphodiesterase family protein [Nitrospiraceae bacterium]